MRWIKFIFSHSLFISICALALSLQTHTLLKIEVSNWVYAFTFFATLCSYNFYWMITRLHFVNGFRPAEFAKQNGSNLALCILSGLCAAYCVYQVPVILPYIIPAVFLTVLYSVPLWPVKQPQFIQKAGFMKTVLLAFTWTYVTVIIPMQETVWIKTYSTVLLFMARFSFMLMLCIIFDRRDAEVDRVHSFHTLATDVSPRVLTKMMELIFAIYLGAGLLLRYNIGDGKQVFAFLISGLATLIVYRFSSRKQGYYFYYFIVDGLMLFSALTTLFMATI